jgi:hypothetical protein
VAGLCPTSWWSVVPGQAQLRLTNADQGDTFRVHEGTVITVALLNTAEGYRWSEMWSSQPSSVARTHDAAATDGSRESRFLALRAGTVELSASMNPDDKHPFSRVPSFLWRVMIVVLDR